MTTVLLKLTDNNYLVRPPNVQVKIIASPSGTVLFEGKAPIGYLNLAVPSGETAEISTN